MASYSSSQTAPKIDKVPNQPNQMLLFNPSQRPSLTQQLAHSPTRKVRETIGRVKARKHVGWYKNTLIGKAKVVHTKKSKQGIASLFSTGRQLFCCLQHNRAPLCKGSLRKTNTVTSNVLPFLLLPPALYAENNGLEHPFGLLGSPFLAVSPPMHTQPPCQCDSTKSRKNLL